MSSETAPLNPKTLSLRRNSATPFRWSLGRRRPRLPTVRLGGKRPRHGLSLPRLCKKAKLKWLELKYMSILKKLKNYYKGFMKDLMEGSTAIESYQQRMFLEASFGIPVMGLSMNSYHSSN
ncbi:uncharacterized protein LOC125205099 [Salvia hispanica]|uniref:uncharacterized protein LOC125205099 n=1 Tax=Salvia hispanica TaxID=49212 RepID=UPI002008F409|nr:uncharacterized protein LOC125205099 [Salvia hispanica]